MLAILFPHLFEDVKFLIPLEDPDSQGSLPPTGESQPPQPIAGPSRLR
jgi:hypothetical protein